MRCVLYLARRGRGTLVSRKEIADEADIPGQFLAKIAQQLARQGIIEIQQGASGGYRLLAGPEQITMLEVIETIIGEIALNDCVIRPGSCDNSSICAVHRVWNQAQVLLRDHLRGVTFADLLAEEERIAGC